MEDQWENTNSEEDWMEEDFRRQLDRYKPTYERYRQGTRFIEGIFLGLFYGVLGNVLVSHYFGLIESLTLSRYNAMFRVNCLVLSVAAVAILVVSVIYYRRFRTWRKEEKNVQQEAAKIILKDMFGIIAKEGEEIQCLNRLRAITEVLTEELVKSK